MTAIEADYIVSRDGTILGLTSTGMSLITADPLVISDPGDVVTDSHLQSELTTHIAAIQHQSLLGAGTLTHADIDTKLGYMDPLAYSPQRYNAVGDGTTDDSAAINTMMTAANVVIPINTVANVRQREHQPARMQAPDFTTQTIV